MQQQRKPQKRYDPVGTTLYGKPGLHTHDEKGRMYWVPKTGEITVWQAHEVQELRDLGFSLTSQPIATAQPSAEVQAATSTAGNIVRHFVLPGSAELPDDDEDGNENDNIPIDTLA